MNNELGVLLDDIKKTEQLGDYTTDQAVEILKLFELCRISEKMDVINSTLAELKSSADALELIEGHLDALSDCINERNQFCITGAVMTYEP